jgi:hypothetical protein
MHISLFHYQGKMVLFVRPLKYYKIFVYYYNKIGMLVIFNIVSMLQNIYIIIIKL